MNNRFQIQKGADVYDSNGNKIGDVGAIGDGHMDVETGGFLGIGSRQLYVPFSDVSQVENDGNKVCLSMSKDQIESQGMTQPSQTFEANQPQGYETGQQPAWRTTPLVGEEAGFTESGNRLVGMSDDLTGHTLYSSDNQEIGKVYDEGPNYAHVRTGLFGLGGDLYVPTGCITNCSGDKCYIGVPADQIKSMGWTAEPRPGAVSGCEGQAAGQTVTRAQANVPKAAPEQAQGVQRLPLAEEELEVHRHRHQVGEVDVTKHVEQEQRTIEVPVTHDEVVITERPEDRPATQPISAQGEINVPVYDEEVHVQKEAHVYGEVEISKQPVTEEKEIRGTVRREVPEIHKKGEVENDVQVKGNLEGNEEKPPERRQQR